MAQRHQETHITTKFKRIASRYLIFVTYVTGALLSGIVAAQDSDTQIKQEYFVRQKANEALFIRINTFEAEFESRLLGPAGELLVASSVGDSRMAPVFQFVAEVNESRQLGIAVASSLNTDRAKFSLGLTRLTVWDDRSKALARAYQLLSFGTEKIHADFAANWTVKISSLINAGNVFKSMGMKELSAWSNYLAAHFIHFRLHDYTIALDLSREILKDLKGTRWQEIVLATLQLQSDTLIRLRETGALRALTSGPDPLQSVLLQVAELANSMDFQYERARAINKSGRLFSARSLYPQALQQFQLAVEISDTLAADTLSTAIRESIVNLHATQGDVLASNTVLQEIETQLAEQGASSELAINLLQQGRLLISTYKYPEAIEVLLRSLEIENDSSVRRQANFELARASYASGQLERALRYLRAAGINLDSRLPQGANSLVDIAEGFRIMANIYRSEADYARMQQARYNQGQYLKHGQRGFEHSKAAYHYDQGLDKRAQQGLTSEQAQAFFRQSYLAAGKSGRKHLQHLARLQVCTLKKAGADAGQLCSTSRIKDSYNALLASAVSRHALEAMFLKMRYLRLHGQHAEATRLADKLINELHFLSSSLPGVSATWYWDRHAELFEDYLELKIADENQGRRKPRTAGLESLVALTKIRYITHAKGIEQGLIPAVDGAEPLRNLLAKLDSSSPGDDLAGLKRRVNKGMEMLRADFQKQFTFLSKAGIQQYLRSINRDEAVLTYHISRQSAHLWIGRHGKIQRHHLAHPQEVYAAVQAARKDLSGVADALFRQQMDRLGDYLLAPVKGLLPATIYWIPAGSLLGLPLDALRLDGHYLAERHSVVNLQSFPARPNPGGVLRALEKSGSPRSVFVAGHPQNYSAAFADRLDTSTQIRAVADIFVGSGLRIVQGTALLADELQDQRFQQADLIHLSMPGVIDLQYPWRSKLELSEVGRGMGRGSFSAENIQILKLNADLVFLGSTRVHVGPITDYEQQLGLISNFLDAGASVVISSMWKINAGASEQLIVDFYHRLQASGNIAQALTDTKRHYLLQGQNNKPADWAGLQVFIK